jgi:hypothetical protein
LIANDIIWRLAQLASLPYQERYIISATVDEYILAVELLENVQGLKYLVLRPEHQGLTDNNQLSSLVDLIQYIEVVSGEALSAKSPEENVTLIRDSSAWKTLRAKAAETLWLFGIDINELTTEKIDLLSE